jgi:large subunit ribosomal protein L23
MDLTQIIKKPIITEKSTRLVTEGNNYTFQVDRRATKFQIKKAVESIFRVQVEGVRTANISGQSRRAGRMRRAAKQPGFKKAVVIVKEGEKIEGLEVAE